MNETANSKNGLMVWWHGRILMEMVSEAPLGNMVLHKTIYTYIYVSVLLLYFLYICVRGEPLKVSQLDVSQM